MTGSWARLESDARQRKLAWSAILPSSVIALVLVSLLACTDKEAENLRDTFRAAQAVDLILRYCDAADACREKEFGAPSTDERQLCLEGISVRQQGWSSAKSKMLASQDIECRLLMESDDPCLYLDCMSLKFDSFQSKD